MATYETMEEQTTSPISNTTVTSLIDSEFVPVVLQEVDSGTPLLVKTRTDFIEGVLPTTKGGTGIDKLQGKRLIASNVDGSSLEEVDIMLDYLSGLKENVQDKLNSIRNYKLTVTTDNWISSDSGYYKEFTLTGILPTDNPLIGLLIQSTSINDIETEKYNYSCIDKVETDTDKVIIRCFDEVPTGEIVLSFICI